ncbi:flavin monoamine oxidase family protein [Phenylobacterium montanum]|uniref:Tryptophan 2-monooxygenase n=2 Tax=Phenylobacterium montanum TaxID=2823693 RepID=A0A975IXA4_9CAUL|nr:flavin monoamine oxidase family protein [Caulobacter sp. S6]
MSRRSLFAMIGTVAGGAVMLEAMSRLAYAGESGFNGPIELSQDSKGASVLILGAGLAGMCAAYELRKAGYKVQVLEYNDRPGGRNWSLYGGDTYTELGGFKQEVRFDKGLYFNPGPWRLPHHHYAVLHYCKLLNVALEPFIQTNYAAYVHSTKAFGGKPKRYREVQADFDGHVAELLAKSTQQGKLDQAVTREDREVLLEAMREWGALDKNYEYKKGVLASERRGWDSDPGGGLTSMPTPSEPMAMSDLLKSGLWGAISAGQIYEFQQMIFQPVGGMGMIGKAFGRELDGLIHYNAKVIDIHQDDHGVVATFQDAKAGGAPQQAKADWCVCTIPATILGQTPINVGAPMKSAIDALYYDASVKVGLQFKRRFWEQDDAIYGGISFTDQPNAMIGYPSTDYFSSGKGVLLGAYTFGPSAFEFAAMSPEERISKALEYGANIHPQYRTEFETGAAVAWHRVPWTLGCAGHWTEELRDQHYDNLCAIDGRIVLAGEHASRLPAWQEGALLSSLDAIRRLHQRVQAS